MSLLTSPYVPEGMVELMTGLSKSVIKDRPKNIYEFAAEFFEKMLIERDGSLDKGYGKFRSYTEYCKFMDKMEQRRLKQPVSYDEVDSGKTNDGYKLTDASRGEMVSKTNIQIQGVAIQGVERKPKDNVKNVSINPKYKSQSDVEREIVRKPVVSSVKNVKPKPRKLSSKKPSENLIVIKEETSTDVDDIASNEESNLYKSALVIQKAVRKYLSSQADNSNPRRNMEGDNTNIKQEKQFQPNQLVHNVVDDSSDEVKDIESQMQVTDSDNITSTLDMEAKKNQAEEVYDTSVRAVDEFEMNSEPIQITENTSNSTTDDGKVEFEQSQFTPDALNDIEDNQDLESESKQNEITASASPGIESDRRMESESTSKQDLLTERASHVNTSIRNQIHDTKSELKEDQIIGSAAHDTEDDPAMESKQDRITTSAPLDIQGDQEMESEAKLNQIKENVSHENEITSASLDIEGERIMESELKQDQITESAFHDTEGEQAMQSKLNQVTGSTSQNDVGVPAMKLESKPTELTVDTSNNINRPETESDVNQLRHSSSDENLRQPDRESVASVERECVLDDKSRQDMEVNQNQSNVSGNTAEIQDMNRFNQPTENASDRNKEQPDIQSKHELVTDVVSKRITHGLEMETKSHEISPITTDNTPIHKDMENTASQVTEDMKGIPVKPMDQPIVNRDEHIDLKSANELMSHTGDLNEQREDPNEQTEEVEMNLFTVKNDDIYVNLDLLQEKLGKDTIDDIGCNSEKSFNLNIHEREEILVNQENLQHIHDEQPLVISKEQVVVDTTESSKFVKVPKEEDLEENLEDKNSKAKEEEGNEEYELAETVVLDDIAVKQDTENDRKISTETTLIDKTYTPEILGHDIDPQKNQKVTLTGKPQETQSNNAEKHDVNNHSDKIHSHTIQPFDLKRYDADKEEMQSPNSLLKNGQFLEQGSENSVQTKTPGTNLNTVDILKDKTSDIPIDLQREVSTNDEIKDDLFTVSSTENVATATQRSTNSEDEFNSAGATSDIATTKSKITENMIPDDKVQENSTKSLKTEEAAKLLEQANMEETLENVEKTSEKANVEKTSRQINLQNMIPDDKVQENSTKSLKTEEAAKLLEQANMEETLENVEKTSEKANVEKTSRQINLQNPSEQVNMEQTSEQVNMEKILDQVNVEKTSEQVNVDTTSEQVNVEKTPEQVNVEKNSEQVNVEKTSEKVNVEKTSEQVNVDTTSEQVNVDTTSEQVNVEKTPEQMNVEKTSKQANVEKTSEQVNVEKTSEQANVDTTSEQVNVDTTSEQVNVEKTPEQMNVEKTSKQANVERTSEQVNVDTTSEQVSVEKTPEQVNVEKNSEQVNVEKTSEQANVEKPSEQVNVYTISEQVNLDTSSEQVNVEKTPEQMNVEKTSKQANVERTSEQVNVEKTSEQVNMEKNSEQVNVEKNPEQVNVEKTSEQVNMDTTSEQANVDTTSGQVNVEKTSEQVNVEKNSEQVNVEKSSEQVNMEKNSEQVNVEQTSEQVNVDSTSEQAKVDTTSEQVNVDTTSEQVNVEKTSEQLNVEKSSEQVNVQKNSEQPNVENTSEQLNVENTLERLNLEESNTSYLQEHEQISTENNNLPYVNQLEKCEENDKLTKAATAIQKVFRGYIVRKSKLIKLNNENNELKLSAALTIQKYVRGYLTRRRLTKINSHQIIHVTSNETNENPESIQSKSADYVQNASTSHRPTYSNRFLIPKDSFLERESFADDEDYAKTGKELAATSIQKTYRGYRVRRSLKSDYDSSSSINNKTEENFSVDLKTENDLLDDDQVKSVETEAKRVLSAVLSAEADVRAMKTQESDTLENLPQHMSASPDKNKYVASNHEGKKLIDETPTDLWINTIPVPNAPILEDDSILGPIVNDNIHVEGQMQQKYNQMTFQDNPINPIEELSDSSEQLDTPLTQKISASVTTPTMSNSKESTFDAVKSFSYEQLSSDLSDTDDIKRESFKESEIDETSRDERDDLSEVENFDLSSCGEDSLEAMYYSIRKNEIMLDKMQKHVAEHRDSKNEELGPVGSENSKVEFPERITENLDETMKQVFKSIESSSDYDGGNKDDGEDSTTLDIGLDDSSSVNDEKEIETSRHIKHSEKMNIEHIEFESTETYSESNDNEGIKEGPLHTDDSESSDQNFTSDIGLSTDRDQQSFNSLSPMTRLMIKSQSVSDEMMNPIMFAMKRKQALLDQLHVRPYPLQENLSEEHDDFSDHLLTDMDLGNIQRKIFASSVSETDSDYIEPTTNRRLVRDDFNISTALDHLSTDSDSTIVSAATKIQAGARGFLTRRRLRRSSAGGTSVSFEKRYSFGNAAIDKSLEDLINRQEQINLDGAASKIQQQYRKYRDRKRNLKKVSPIREQTLELSSDSSGEVNDKENIGIRDIKVAQRKTNHDDGDNTKNDSEENLRGNNRPSSSNIDDVTTAPSVKTTPINQRRLTLQRGDAVQRNSRPDSPELNVKPVNLSSHDDENYKDYETGEYNGSMAIKMKKKVTPYINIQSLINRGIGPRQRSMPVQIDSELMRIIPKHLRKRVKSADIVKKKGH